MCTAYISTEQVFRIESTFKAQQKESTLVRKWARQQIITKKGNY